MSTKIHSKTVNYGIIRQNPASAAATAFLAIGSTANQWTNPGLAATNYRTFYITPGSMIPDPNVQVEDLNYTSQLGLHKEVTQRFVNSVSGLKKLPFSMTADRNTLAPLLVAALQSCEDVATTPYQKTIISAFKAGCLDFNGGGGFLHTIAYKSSSSADDGWILENAIIDTLTLTWDFLQPGKGKLVSISGVWVGNEFNVDQTHSGTWVATTPIPINNADTFSFSTFTVDSVDVSALCVKRISLTINNNVTSNCATSAGKPNQYDVNPSYTWSIQMDHNSTTEKFLGDFQAGANVDITFVNSIASGTSGHLSIDMPYGRIKSNPFGFDGDYLSETLEVEAEQNSTTSPLTILLADTLQWAYREV
jgi:hypothetical protein